MASWLLLCLLALCAQLAKGMSIASPPRTLPTTIASSPRWSTKYWSEHGDKFYQEQFGEAKEDQLPVVYHDCYNIGFFGLERLHPFDSFKFRRIRDGLVAAGIVKKDATVTPKPATRRALSLIHTPEYLGSLDSPANMARIAEFPPLAFMPAWMVRSKFTEPNLHHVGGTILAGKLALDRGWAVSLGGGMHHAHASGGGGWCVFADVVLSYQHLRLAFPERVARVLIVDLDVHQGNGHERDKLTMGDTGATVFTLDAFRPVLFPQDTYATSAIDVRVNLTGCETDSEYLKRIEAALAEALGGGQPGGKEGAPPFDICYYIAGTDILVGDPLGGMNISPEGVAKRDEAVWRACANAGVPLVHLLAGGYTKPLSANTCVSSFVNLHKKGLMTVKETAEKGA
ncbi:hypothetical protein JKP88DRAFT_267619 [Tribonema minus]|uniref:Histone deacetylase domain-containing protein n=1 Tax=Tribonema minus TaxID=303371 RepID=A0A835ZG23_9STRA|nr:hypothetical protein JKP88DRAFT_267619 [Tribonema minus]